MEQVPPQEVKAGFNRLLQVGQEVARERTGRLVGQTKDVLFEEVNGQDETMLTGRLSNNSIVHVKADKALIGRIVPVKLTQARGFYYLGELAEG